MRNGNIIFSLILTLFFYFFFSVSPCFRYTVLYPPMDVPLKFDPSWTTGQRGPGNDEYTIKIFEVSDEAWALNEVEGDDSECHAALKKDAAVEVVIGAARVDLFPTFSFDLTSATTTTIAAVGESSGRGESGESGESGEKGESGSGEESKGGASAGGAGGGGGAGGAGAGGAGGGGGEKIKKKSKPKGALRARAASVRVTLLLRMIIDAIRQAAADAQTKQRLDAVSLAHRVRARSDSRGSISSDPGHHREGSSNVGPRRRTNRRSSSSLITDSAILEALNVADVLLPYIEDTERALHFQLNGLTVKIDNNGRVAVTNHVKVTENGVTVQREGDHKSSCLTFRMRVTAGEFIHDIMTLAMDGVS